MEKRILRLEDEFWRIRTDTGALADAERNALRAYLDEKGFKTAIIDDNLAIAGELTWKEVLKPASPTVVRFRFHIPPSTSSL